VNLLLPPLVGFTVLGQDFAWPDLAVVALLVLLEGMLSIDNALVLGLLAKRLPKNEQSKALWYGLAGAFAFRFVAVLTASLLLRWTFAKFLGGAYLVYISIRHLFFESKEEEKEKIELDEYGHPVLIEQTGKPLTAAQEELEIEERVPVYMTPERRKQLGLASFWPTVLLIELTDIAFAVDSILAAIAMVGAPPAGLAANAFHPKLWVVVFGGIIGLMLMRVAARWFIYLLERFPTFEVAAYLLVIVIGFKLLADWGFNSDWSSFPAFENQRQAWIASYENWLTKSWPLGLVHHKALANPNIKQVAHLLDFHTPRRPEFIIFWVLMVVCFCVGFLPRRNHAPSAAAGVT